ncbi:hypothetical protein H8S90_05770 [Olivibacter sp. SDN3]|uniref:hypothetical protein n=1 Tax=Olivibacter sp. SDN3 TaxID=2764720 RepID=UPI0016510B99|nr:hypothetical protein [Olivibacter sp. SDN3]QNL51091.1 hypothetical protein H8S90_05770 [Olivibacter sp. SDN3]
MKKSEVEHLKAQEQNLHQYRESTLLETHISWVILTDQQVYKIKKPVKFSFLDFSSLVKRKYYCEQELLLNKRLAKEMYLEVVPVFQRGDHFSFDGHPDNIVDYAVLMKRMDTAKEMDRMLKEEQVDKSMIDSLAREISAFHAQATVIRKDADVKGQKELFNDLATLQGYIQQHLGEDYGRIVRDSTIRSGQFLQNYESFITQRPADGFVRDLHGDLHAGNIFLYEDPVIFDCIEFNDAMRQVDVLDEVAFLCMDLEAYGYPDLSDYLLQNYLRYSQIALQKEERLLFDYYKAYRANIRAKVHVLHAKEASVPKVAAQDLKMAVQYLNVLNRYL